LASSGGHVPILVHWGGNRHIMDKSGGLSIIIPKKKIRVFCDFIFKGWSVVY
jgi:hypothetical protein